MELDCRPTIVQFLIPKLLEFGVDINRGALVTYEYTEDCEPYAVSVKTKMSRSILFSAVGSIACNNSIEGWILLRWLVEYKAIDLNKGCEFHSSGDSPMHSQCLFVHLLELWCVNYMKDRPIEILNSQTSQCIEVMDFLIASGHNAFKDSVKIIDLIIRVNTHFLEVHVTQMLRFFSEQCGYDIQKQMDECKVAVIIRPVEEQLINLAPLQAAQGK
jgi:hypothetical protein